MRINEIDLDSGIEQRGSPGPDSVFFDCVSSSDPVICGLEFHLPVAVSRSVVKDGLA